MGVKNKYILAKYIFIENLENFHFPGLAIGFRFWTFINVQFVKTC